MYLCQEEVALRIAIIIYNLVFNMMKRANQLALTALSSTITNLIHYIPLWFLRQRGTLQKDFDIYAQQIKDSSLDELIEYKMQTKWEYTNNDTTYYQFFDNYLSDIETHYAQLSDGTYSDKIKYTDINIYMSIDDIDSSLARRKVRDSKTGKPIKDDNGNTVYENVDTDRCIYISPNIERISQYSSMKFYQGDKVDTTKRLKKDESLY